MISITVPTLLRFFSLSGMASVLRFCRHHPDYLLVEYKPLLQHVMKHVKNLRSQVMHVNVNNICIKYICRYMISMNASYRVCQWTSERISIPEFKRMQQNMCDEMRPKTSALSPK